MFEFFWSRNASLWIAILYVLMGLPLLLFPGLSGTVFCWALAAGALVYAISRLIRWFQAKKENYSSTGDLVLAVLFFATALFCIFGAELILSFLPLVLGILLLLDGIGKLPIAVSAWKEQSLMKMPLLISSLIPLVLGILLIANPFGAAKIVIRVFGLALLLDGISDLIAVFFAHSLSKQP